MFRLTRPLCAVSIFLGVLTSCAAAAADNAELKRIYDEDQNDRDAPPGKMDWKTVAPRDEARRRRVREMIDQGGISTGKDYERAAMIYQHGDGSDDILMAHVLAVTAIGKGDTGARWLAAASLDRLLQRLKQPQVFGTQFLYNTENNRNAWTMEPYNRALIPASLRRANCVPDQHHQDKMLAAIRAGKEPPEPEEPPCSEPPAQ